MAECPKFPACVLRSVEFSIPADTLFRRAEEALQLMQPLETLELGDYRVTSVHRAGFFKDDFEFVVHPTPDGSVLHIRSASRTGHWDLGVNGRRVRRFIRAIRRVINDS